MQVSTTVYSGFPPLKTPAGTATISPINCTELASRFKSTVKASKSTLVCSRSIGPNS